MGEMVGGLFGGNQSELRAARAEQDKQRQALEAEKARLARAEEGRNKLKSSRRGLLAFLDNDPELTKTMGGSADTDGVDRRRRSEAVR